MYGVAKDINLGPVGRVPYKTRIPNLYMAGQNVNSHGMLGVIVGTIVTCSELVPASQIMKQIDEANA
jgi:all-trans-retinol 13,14-reductase